VRKLAPAIYFRLGEPKEALRACDAGLADATGGSSDTFAAYHTWLEGVRAKCLMG